MAKGGNNNTGCGVGVFLILMAISALTMVPVEFWIGLGVLVGVGVAVFIGVKINESRVAGRKLREAAAERARAAAELAEKHRRDNELGKANAKRLASAEFSVNRVLGSEAAQAGWLGDVDFTDDLACIADSFRKAHELRATADALAQLDRPSDQDRSILAEARSTADALERSAIAQADLIGKCAAEAQLVDRELQRERDDARTAEQRDALHRQLNAMMYGVEAPVTTEPDDSAASQVLARVAGYREVKQRIELTRRRDLN